MIKVLKAESVWYHFYDITFFDLFTVAQNEFLMQIFQASWKYCPQSLLSVFNTLILNAKNRCSVNRMYRLKMLVLFFTHIINEFFCISDIRYVSENCFIWNIIFLCLKLYIKVFYIYKITMQTCRVSDVKAN